MTTLAVSGRRSTNGCPLLQVFVHDVCVFTAVCVHFGWVNCRAQKRDMSHLRHHSAILENICWILTSERIQRILSKIVLRWHRWDELLNWSYYFYFLCIQKVFLSPHKVQIEPLMADGLFWRCLSYFSGPWQCYLIDSQWDSYKPLSFHPNYLNLCSEDEQSFYGFGMTWR